MNHAVLTTFASILGSIIALWVVVYVIRYDLAYKNKRVGRVIKVVFLAVFLGLFWGWAAIGFVIGLAAGAVIGTIMGVSIGLMTGSLLEQWGQVRESTPMIGMIFRFVTGGLVGALHGTAVGLIILTMMGISAFESSIWGAGVGAVIGMAIARQVSTTPDAAVRAETNSLQSTGIACQLNSFKVVNVQTRAQAPPKRHGRSGLIFSIEIEAEQSPENHCCCCGS